MPERLPEINLLPRYERRSERSYTLFVLFTVFVFLSFILLGVFYFITNSKLATAEDVYDQLNNEAEILQSELDQLEIGDGPSLADAVAFVEQQIIETSAFITQLDDLLPGESYLSNYEYGSQVTSINAHFLELNTVANYTTQLTESDYIRDTRVNEIRTVYSQDESDDISHYDARYTLNVYKQKLKKESKKDE